MVTLPFCPNCGREVRESDTFCPSCGTSLRNSASSLVRPNSPRFTTDRPDAEANTAKTLTLVAMIVQVLFIGLIGLGAATLGALSGVVNSIATTTTVSGTTVTYSNPFRSPSFVMGFVATILGIGIVVSVIWVVLDYLLIYKNLRAVSTIESAKTPALILGILQIFFGGVIPGILLIFAYLKIGESINNKRQMSTITH